MIDIVTYQDLLVCGQDEKRRMEFIRRAVRDYKSSAAYRTAVDAEMYYRGENPTITRYEKIIYDMKGMAHKDMYTANHKIKSQFFRTAVDQLKSYLLGNGVTFSSTSTKKKLGRTFDQQISKAAKFAQIGGVSFGLWNLDHLEIFKSTEFLPIYDEETGALMAGVRFWQLAPSKPERYTLYELDGYAEYIHRQGEEMQWIRPKRPYKINVVVSGIEEGVILDGENYPAFPIVPMKNNDGCLSEIIGKQNTIDALDLCRSGMVNNVDEGNIIYWALQNSGGMSITDAEKFLYQVKTSHVAWVDDDGASAEPHTIEAPYVGTQTAIDMLQKTLYQDFQAFDSSAVSAGNQTATAIKASYAPLDLKADDFELQVTTFILGILEVAGIDDEPSYTRNKIVNTQEEVQTVLAAAQYFDEEYTTKKLLTILGDADQYEDIVKRKAAEDLARFYGGVSQDGIGDPEEGENE